MFYLSPHNFLPNYRNKIVLTEGILGTYSKILIVFSYFYFLVVFNFVSTTFLSRSYLKFMRTRIYYVTHFPKRFKVKNAIKFLNGSKFLCALLPVLIYIFSMPIVSKQDHISANRHIDNIVIQYGLNIAFMGSFFYYIVFVYLICLQNSECLTEN